MIRNYRKSLIDFRLSIFFLEISSFVLLNIIFIFSFSFSLLLVKHKQILWAVNFVKKIKKIKKKVFIKDLKIIKKKIWLKTCLSQKHLLKYWTNKNNCIFKKFIKGENRLEKRKFSEIFKFQTFFVTIKCLFCGKSFTKTHYFKCFEINTNTRTSHKTRQAICMSKISTSHTCAICGQKTKSVQIRIIFSFPKISVSTEDSESLRLKVKNKNLRSITSYFYRDNQTERTFRFFLNHIVFNEKDRLKKISNISHVLIAQKSIRDSQRILKKIKDSCTSKDSCVTISEIVKPRNKYTTEKIKFNHIKIEIRNLKIVFNFFFNFLRFQNNQIIGF